MAKKAPVKVEAVSKTKKAKREPGETKVVGIPPISVGLMKIKIVGDTPLLVNRFDEKSKTEMQDKQTKKATNKRDFGSAEDQMERTLYRMPGKSKKYGVPVAGLKNCAVTATRFVDGIPSTVAVGSFHIIGDEGGLVAIDGSEPVMDERIVRVGNFPNKKPCVRVRGRFDKWSITISIRYNERVISASQIVNLYENAGFSVGLCEYRPEKKGNLGMFSVAKG